MKTRIHGYFISIPLLSILCSGCLGYSLVTPETVEIEKPLPLAVDDWSGPSRWACESRLEPFSPSSKEDVENAWGEPGEKIVSADSETWIYKANSRWCGLWLGFIIPVPLVLPVCETFDHVRFEGDVAVGIKSRRITRSTAGIALHPAMPYPVPVLSRPGKVTENKASIAIFPEPEHPYKNSCGF